MASLFISNYLFIAEYVEDENLTRHKYQKDNLTSKYSDYVFNKTFRQR